MQTEAVPIIEPSAIAALTALPAAEQLSQLRAQFRGNAQCVPAAEACLAIAPLCALCFLSLSPPARGAEEAAAFSRVAQAVVPALNKATLFACASCVPAILSHAFQYCESSLLGREGSATLLRTVALPLLQSGAAALAATPPPPAASAAACLTEAHATFARLCLLQGEFVGGALLAKGVTFTDVAAGTRAYHVVLFYHASGLALLGGGDAGGAAAAFLTALSLAVCQGRQLATSTLALDVYRKWALASLLALPYGAGAPSCPPDASGLRAASPGHAEVVDAYVTWAAPAQVRVAMIAEACEKARSEFGAAGAATLLRVVRASAAARELQRLARTHSRLPVARACAMVGVDGEVALGALLLALPLIPGAPIAAFADGGAILTLSAPAADDAGRLTAALRTTDAVAAAVSRAEEAMSTSVPLLRQALRSGAGGSSGGGGGSGGGGFSAAPAPFGSLLGDGWQDYNEADFK